MLAQVVDAEMRAYYDARADEYDDWWLGTGLFADRDRPGWSEEVQTVINVVGNLPGGRVLDVACGTGFLTRHLYGEIVALDQSLRMLDIAAARMPYATVVCADAVPLPFDDGALDRVFTSHFYGRLLPGEREALLAEVFRVAPSVAVVDSAQRVGRPPEEWQERVLNDGSTHRVYKRFFDGAAFAEELDGGASTRPLVRDRRCVSHLMPDVLRRSRRAPAHRRAAPRRSSCSPGSARRSSRCGRRPSSRS